MRSALSYTVVLLLGLLAATSGWTAPPPESFDEEPHTREESGGRSRLGRSADPMEGIGRSTDNVTLNLGAVLDAVQTVHTDRAEGERNAFELRSFEVNVGGAVDPHFDARASFAFHDAEVELEEGYVMSALPPSLSGARIRFGKEKVQLGYLNRLHEHDFPQLDAPVPFEKMLGEEGVRLEGGHLAWLFATTDRLTVGFQAGLYSGFGRDEEHGHHGGLGTQFAGEKRPYHVRGTLFFESPDLNHGLLLGTSYLDVLDNEVRNAVEADSSAGFTVVDLKYRYRPSGAASQLILAGEWFRNEGIPASEPVDGTRTEDFTGWYGYVRYDLDRYRGVGYRYGQSEHLNNPEEVQNNTLFGEYRPSEFSRIRVQAKRNTHPEQPDETLFGVQGTVFLGWHPAHRF